MNKIIFGMILFIGGEIQSSPYFNEIVFSNPTNQTRQLNVQAVALVGNSYRDLNLWWHLRVYNKQNVLVWQTQYQTRMLLQKDTQHTITFSEVLQMPKGDYRVALSAKEEKVIVNNNYVMLNNGTADYVYGEFTTTVP